jgi:23S rRNA (cytidine1920-2'-O)/16S rRNA (cytidine1409-2'-O)-methyltransferase
MPPRQRADRLLVERGLFESRAKAQAAIGAGLVTADAAPVRKPSEEIAVDAALAATPAFAWVSRGGVKLAAALDRFGLDVADKVCLDVGASTGGFTEVLLARGARRVYAVDVGTGQLHPRLRGRPEIVSMEETDIRALDPATFVERPSLVTIDASFISLKLVLPTALALASRPADIVALIKPQFEVPRPENKKGVVRSTEVHRRVCEDMGSFAASLGLERITLCESAITGGDGNREFFLAAHLG